MAQSDKNLKAIYGGESKPESGGGNTGLPFGLCKKYGIAIQPEWTPKDAWAALKDKVGITPEKAYAEADKKEHESKQAEYDKRESEREKVAAIYTSGPEVKGNDSPYTADAYSKERKDRAAWDKSEPSSLARFGAWSDEIFAKASDFQKNATYDYTKESNGYNLPLRGYRYGWGKSNYYGAGRVPLNQEGKSKQIQALSKLIDKSVSKEDVWLQRGVGLGGAASLLGLDKLTVEGIQELIDKRIDRVDHGFVSTSAHKGGGQSFAEEPVVLNIYAPKGTRMLYVGRRSYYRKENEMLLQRGTSFRPTKVEFSNGKFYIDLEVVGQNPKDFKEYRK